METNSVVDFSVIPSGCQNCHLFEFCQPRVKSRLQIHTLEKVIIRNHKFERGEYLFRENDIFKTIYVIRSGSVKTYTNIEDGQEHVNGFHLPGKLLGLDAIGVGHHTGSAVALETCNVCQIPFVKLEEINKWYPQLQHMLLYAMSKEIRDEHHQLRLISRMHAAARLASFLLSLSRHFQQLGFSASEFNLSLTRSDIANLLGLAVETVSRLFTQFQDDGLLIVDRRHVVIYDLERLMKLSPIYAKYARLDFAIKK